MLKAQVIPFVTAGAVDASGRSVTNLILLVEHTGIRNLTVRQVGVSYAVFAVCPECTEETLGLR